MQLLPKLRSMIQQIQAALASVLGKGLPSADFSPTSLQAEYAELSRREPNVRQSAWADQFPDRLLILKGESSPFPHTALFVLTASDRQASTRSRSSRRSDSSRAIRSRLSSTRPRPCTTPSLGMTSTAAPSDTPQTQ